MSNTIYDYDAAVSIDGSTHWLLIQPGTNSVDYNRINRQTFLGVSGQPADISTAQNVTNKTLDNTNIVTLRDDRFTLQDSGDVTRQATFQLSGITAGNTRVMTLPDASTTLVGTGTTQTLTNKTITSPVITGGTISNSTISVDAIAEYTAANGVTVDGLNIKDGALNTNNSVVTANVTDSAITPAKLLTGTGSGWTWQSWTPTWTNFTIGNGTVNEAKYIQIGKTVFVRYSVSLGSSSSMGTAPTFTLPVTAATYTLAGGSDQQLIGRARLTEGGVGSSLASVVINSTTVAGILSETASGSYVALTNITSTVPITWGTSDAIAFYATYEAA